MIWAAMIRLAMLGLALALTGCSDDPAKTETAETRPTPQGSPASRSSNMQPAASKPGYKSPFGRGEPLTGEVSELIGEVTDFQIEETDTATIVRLAADVLFEFDTAELGARAPEQLRRAADLIAKGAPGTVPIVGHTDSKGTDAYNDDLSLRRARSVAAWLSAEGGVPAARLQAEGRGEAEPAVANTTPGGADDPEGRARNRRVVVVIPRA